jgi:hypothetical protein
VAATTNGSDYQREFTEIVSNNDANKNEGREKHSTAEEKEDILEGAKLIQDLFIPPIPKRTLLDTRFRTT